MSTTPAQSEPATAVDSTCVPQTFLPRQVAAPQGPVDARMMYVSHFAFRRDLAMFVAAARRTPCTDREAWAALADRWDLFSLVLHHHHAGEDAGLWPLLLDRADEAERAVLDDMEAEHALIDPLLKRCTADFAAAREADDQGVADRLAQDLAEAQECLARHLAHEETAAMTMVQRHLTDAEWRAMAKENFEKGQTLPQMLAVLPWMAHEMPDEDLTSLVAYAGFPFGLLLRLTRRRFARRDAVATRHLRGAA